MIEETKQPLVSVIMPCYKMGRGKGLGIIGRNGAGNQAAGQPLGRLPKVARRVRRRGKARINMTLLKILLRVTTQSLGQIKGDLGSLGSCAGIEVLVCTEKDCH